MVLAGTNPWGLENNFRARLTPSLLGSGPTAGQRDYWMDKGDSERGIYSLVCIHRVDFCYDGYSWYRSGYSPEDVDREESISKCVRYDCFRHLRSSDLLFFHPDRCIAGSLLLHQSSVWLASGISGDIPLLHFTRYARRLARVSSGRNLGRYHGIAQYRFERPSDQFFTRLHHTAAGGEFDRTGESSDFAMEHGTVRGLDCHRGNRHGLVHIVSSIGQNHSVGVRHYRLYFWLAVESSWWEY